MIAAVRSDTGKVREINEDYTFLSKQYQNNVFLAIVADGMGGHLAGEVASKIAVNSVRENLDKILISELTIEQCQKELEKAIWIANEKVYKESLENDRLKGMGTTIVTAIISPDWIILGHIGDSRAYLVGNNAITQLTSDHSLVNELLKNGQISEEEALNHPQRNVLTRALGTEPETKIDLKNIEWKKGQTLILCSDGLTNLVEDNEIQSILSKTQNLDEAIEKLILMANNAGGDDNISIILVNND